MTGVKTERIPPPPKTLKRKVKTIVGAIGHAVAWTASTELPTRVQSLWAPRGTLYDRNGRPLIRGRVVGYGDGPAIYASRLIETKNPNSGAPGQPVREKAIHFPKPGDTIETKRTTTYVGTTGAITLPKRHH